MSVAAAIATPAPARRRRRRIAIAFGALGALLLVALGLALAVGAVPLPWAAWLRGEAVTPALRTIFWEIRLPRALLGLCTGAGLAVCGALLQGLFRNPLADAGLLGISGGASLAAASTLVFGASLGEHLGGAALSVAAFGGAAGSTLVVRWLATRDGRTETITLLLAGMAIASAAGAGTGLLTFLSTDTQLRALSLWSLGSLGTATWAKVLWVAGPVTLIFLYAWKHAARLDLLLLGEREAHHLGMDVERWKRRLILLAALGVGACVAASGTIGFVGLVVPHLIRLLLGPSHRILLPAAALGGASLLLSADLFARTVAAPAELPIGAVTAVVGVPFFLYLLRKGARGWQ